MLYNPDLRGTCRAAAETAVRHDPTLRLARGWYHCPLWGPQAHWWAVRPNGRIVDPTAAQFPSGGLGEYEEFTGMAPCVHCGRPTAEDAGIIFGNGHYLACSSRCHGIFIGVIDPDGSTVLPSGKQDMA